MDIINTKFKQYKLATTWQYFSFFLLFSLWFLSRISGLGVVILLLQCVPLLALYPYLRSRYYRAYSWLCFVLLLYFVIAVMGAMSSAGTIFDYLFVALCVSTFISSMMCSRYAQRVQKNITDHH